MMSVPRTATGEAPHRVDTLVGTTGVGGAATLVLVNTLVEIQVELEALQ